MDDNFTLDLTAEVDFVPDGGRVAHLSLRHVGRPVLAGLLVEYEDDLLIADEITLNDCLLPTPTARRLLVHLYRAFIPLVGQCGDCGLLASLNLHAFLCEGYQDARERETVRAMVETALRTFSHSEPKE